MRLVRLMSTLPPAPLLAADPRPTPKTEFFGSH
jgi:hypothetical protein